MPFFEHVRELRRRLIISVIGLAVGFVIAFAVYDYYIQILIEPFDERLYATRIEQAFLMKIKISAYVGIIFSFPIHIYNIVAFILPALTRKERKYMIGLLSGSFVLLVIGGYLGYFQILPLSLKFLKSDALIPANVDTWLSFQDSLLFIFQLMLAFVALFQLPLVLLFLMAMNIVRRAQLFRSGRYVIVAIFITAALLTPPDVVSQIGLGLPLIVLYYVTILIAKIFRFGEPDEYATGDEEEAVGMENG